MDKSRTLRPSLTTFCALSFIFGLIPGPQAFAFTTDAERVQTYLDHKDLLGARVLVRKLYGILKSPADRASIRSVLLHNEDIGDDIIYSWDQNRQKSTIPGAAGITLDPLLKKADALMLSEKFDQAAIKFQQAAQWLKKKKQYELTRPKPSNEILWNIDRTYPYVLHGLARSLYGAGRYAGAIEVYSWIPKNYSRYHKVLFEKMWAAYQAKNIEVALGAIASQRNAFFSSYNEPEAYLIQIYLFKQLCRNADLDALLLEVNEFKTKLNSNQFDYRTLLIRNSTPCDS